MEKLNDLYENYQQNTNNNELKNKIINYLNKNIKLVNEEEIKLTESIENLADTFNTKLPMIFWYQSALNLNLKYSIHWYFSLTEAFVKSLPDNKLQGGVNWKDRLMSEPLLGYKG